MQVEYNSQYDRFATSVTELGPPASGTANASSADLIDSALAAGEKSGYKFTMTGNQSGYAISAVPVAYGNTGSRTFYSDQTRAIRENDGPEPATPKWEDAVNQGDCITGGSGLRSLACQARASG